MSLELPTPDAFLAFPYDPPYDIQTDLMRHLYAAIEQRKVTIVESPTGTGKTLTLLCSSLTWLRDEKDRARKGKMRDLAGCATADEKDWVAQQTLKRVRRELEAEEQDYEEKLRRARKREERQRRVAKARVVKRLKAEKAADEDDGDEDMFLPESDQVEELEAETYVSPALRALMAKVDKTPSSSQDPELTCTKIYYASRTHSQLAQVLPELAKLKFHHRSVTQQSSAGPSRKRPAEEEPEFQDPGPSTRAVSLGSRKQLCINDELRARSKDLDEACRELLQEKDEKRCPYLPPAGEDEQMLDFRDQILATPKDIEDLAESGRTAKICPYFGSRRAIPQAELVTLPYNLLLQKSAREALGIDLKDQVVLIDEAHNLIPTLLSLSSFSVSSTILSTALEQLRVYVQKFRTRLSPANMLHLKRLVLYLDAIKKYTVAWKATQSTAKVKSEVLTLSDLVGRLDKRVAGINLLEIKDYLKRSKVARKISGYAIKCAEKDEDPVGKRLLRKGAIPPLQLVEDFLVSLANTNDDGRIVLNLLSKPGQADFVQLKYQLLNPSRHFTELVEEARCVVLAGGTMSPIPDVIQQLFSTLPAERLSSFSCGHIIPDSNLQTLVVLKGPSGGELEFKAEKQGDPVAIGQLGQILLNFSNVIPAGMIVFFPSYRFLNTAKVEWTKSGLLDKLGRKKKVLFEPEETVEVEKVLSEYSKAVVTVTPGVKGGALLFAVIGAKLSEGLNFADDLARAVIIVGLPFANLGSPELRERMRYVKEMQERRNGKNSGQKDAAAELYENMCMNAVNQSIGRAIRHRGDWASLLLVDRRYSNANIRKKLPGWIGSTLCAPESFGQTMSQMGSFFRSKRA